jgi:hypothetical protein
MAIDPPIPTFPHERGNETVARARQTGSLACDRHNEQGEPNVLPRYPSCGYGAINRSPKEGEVTEGNLGFPLFVYRRKR